VVELLSSVREALVSFPISPEKKQISKWAYASSPGVHLWDVFFSMCRMTNANLQKDYSYFLFTDEAAQLAFSLEWNFRF
jgi:hypothetical protein